MSAKTGNQPIHSLAEAFGTAGDVVTIAQSAQLASNLCIVTLPVAEDSRPWQLFLSRFLKPRSVQNFGLAIILLASRAVANDLKLPLVEWKDRLRRIDISIWADFHAPLQLREPLSTLASALAVELCGWRLDLAAELACARYEDLLNPLSWLQRQSGRAVFTKSAVNGEEKECPVALLEQHNHKQINLRIWRAQLMALFPWIENHRQGYILQYRRYLRLDDHLRDLGLQDIEDIEFGGLARQLRFRVVRAEAELLDCFARLRNCLAHGVPVEPDDLDLALRETKPKSD